MLWITKAALAEKSDGVPLQADIILEVYEYSVMEFAKVGTLSDS